MRIMMMIAKTNRKQLSFEDWVEVETEEDKDFDYPFLPCVDNIWTPQE